VFYYLTLAFSLITVIGVFYYFTTGRKKILAESKVDSRLSVKSSSTLSDTLENVIREGILSGAVDVDLVLLDREIELFGKRWKARIKAKKKKAEQIQETESALVLRETEDGIEVV
jgi:hypothetical protein